MYSGMGLSRPTLERDYTVFHIGMSVERDYILWNRNRITYCVPHWSSCLNLKGVGEMRNSPALFHGLSCENKQSTAVILTNVAATIGIHLRSCGGEEGGIALVVISVSATWAALEAPQPISS